MSHGSTVMAPSGRPRSARLEVVRLNKIAGGLRVSKTETLQRAAHIPVQKPTKAD